MDDDNPKLDFARSDIDQLQCRLLGLNPAERERKQKDENETSLRLETVDCCLWVLNDRDLHRGKYRIHLCPSSIPETLTRGPHNPRTPPPNSSVSSEPSTSNNLPGKVQRKLF